MEIAQSHLDYFGVLPLWLALFICGFQTAEELYTNAKWRISLPYWRIVLRQWY